VVVKLLEGAQGIGVILAESTQVGRGDHRTLAGPGEDERLDPAVREGEPRPRRARVRGRQPRRSRRCGRTGADGEFRSNVHRGGRCEEIQLEPEYERVAVHAAQVMGLRVAGVDLLEGRDGPVLLEVNSSPGLEAIEAATKVDIAGEIVRLIEEEVLFRRSTSGSASRCRAATA
jgi:ribosomal protein S6--L-glutamate ligase